MDHASKGAAAISASDFKAAINHYTKAIAVNPQAADYYIKRSTAYTRLSPPSHDAAYKDSEIALMLASKRAKRELIALSQLRRGIALFGLQRWADAKQCFAWAKKLNEKDNTVKIWEMKVDEKLKSLPENDAARQAAIEEIPDVELPKAETKKAEQKPEGAVAINEEGDANGAKPIAAETAIKSPSEGLQPPVGKTRHEWYETNDSVTVTLYAKGVPKDKATIELQKRSLALSFPLPGGSGYDFTLDPLYADIDEAASASEIKPMKVVFTLKKAIPGQKWHSLEAKEPAKIESPEGKIDENVKRAVLGDKTGDSAPSYPTSSKSGPKNWDKVARDLSKKPDKDGEEGKDDNDASLEDDYEGEPANNWFQQLYKNSSADVRRAMIKSYQESSGTALSTNWAEVSQGPVECSPPTGMVAKKWSE
ncbi:MAG: hypothetical protein Q9191_003901 [Dirinaria sp. TL-2023a]